MVKQVKNANFVKVGRKPLTLTNCPMNFNYNFIFSTPNEDKEIFYLIHQNYRFVGLTCLSL